MVLNIATSSKGDSLLWEIGFKQQFSWLLGRVRLGIFRNKNVFRNIFRLFCSWEQNSQNGIQVFRNENSSQTNVYSHYSNYSYSGLIPNERALSYSDLFFSYTFVPGERIHHRTQEFKADLLKILFWGLVGILSKWILQITSDVSLGIYLYREPTK